jgi:hypothetical protein
MRIGLRTSVVSLLAGGALLAGFGAAAIVRAGASGDGEATCACQLRSWIVAGQGRHLYVDVDCPETRDDLDGVVEFTSTELRTDYRATDDPERDGRIARMTPGVRLEPVVGDGQERVEAQWDLSVAQAEALQRDRLFALRYHLLGPNSNSAMRRVLLDAGVKLPAWMLDEGGPFGQFPGIGLEPGQEIPRGVWGEFGVGVLE